MAKNLNVGPKGTVAATIERCAQVLDKFAANTDNDERKIAFRNAAAAIRTLKEQP